MGQSRYVHLEDCNVLRITDKAVLLEIADEEHWIPISQLADGEDHELEVGDKGITVSVTEWIAKEKGIET